VVAVDEENPAPLAPEQDRQAGACDARADNEDVQIAAGGQVYQSNIGVLWMIVRRGWF
jgi:hypothetical protein